MMMMKKKETEEKKSFFCVFFFLSFNFEDVFFSCCCCFLLRHCSFWFFTYPIKKEILLLLHRPEHAQIHTHRALFLNCLINFLVPCSMLFITLSLPLLVCAIKCTLSSLNVLHSFFIFFASTHTKNI